MATQSLKDRIERIIVRGPNWVGDAVIGVPALRELRHAFPRAQITLVVRPGAEGLFIDAKFIDTLLTYDRRGWKSVFAQVGRWREQRFDLALLFPNSFESALIPFLARIPLRLGYATDGRSGLLTHKFPVPKNRDREHEVFYYLNLVRELARLAGQPVSKATPDSMLDISELRRQQAVEKLLSFGVRQDNTTVALCPGSINSRAKRWPADRYAELADRLIADRDADVLLIGSREELDVAADVRRQMKHAPIDLTGKTSLAEAMAILSVTDLVITNDTGPAHIAAALGRPTLVIFGPTNPLTTRPHGPSAEILRKPPDCAPCMLRDCPIDHRCMTAISVDDVLSKADEILAATRLLEATQQATRLTV